MIWLLSVSPLLPLADPTCFLATLASMDLFKCVTPSHGLRGLHVLQHSSVLLTPSLHPLSLLLSFGSIA